MPEAHKAVRRQSFARPSGVRILSFRNGSCLAVATAVFLLVSPVPSFAVQPLELPVLRVAEGATSDQAMELAFWDAIKDSTDPADFEAYLAQFPDGTFAALARIRINRFATRPAPHPATQDATPPVAMAHDWQTYLNDRFGTSVDYPADLFTPLPPPDNNDGRRFEMPDGRGGFFVYSQYNALGLGLDELYAEDIARDGEQVLYTQKSDRVFGVSGNRGSDIFFRKTMLGADDVIRVLEVFVRNDLAGLFNDISTRMATSFAAPVVEEPPPVATAAAPNGPYDSGWGEITFAPTSDGGVEALYEGGQSRLVGQMQGLTFVGRWIEPHSAQICADNTYWGQIALDFAPDFASFAGKWGYCDGPLSRSVEGTASDVPEAVPQVADAEPDYGPVVLGPIETPQRGSAERKALMDAARVPVVADIGQNVIFLVDLLRSDGEWAYLQATPLQPDGQPLNWTTTNFAADWQMDAMSDTVMVLLNKVDGVWQAVDHVVGPTDVYWYGWIEQYQLPENLFGG